MNNFCSRSRMSELCEGADHVFRCNLQLNSIQPRLYPTNISLWRFPLCNPLKLYLLICISITESPSVFFLPRPLAALWNERRVCIPRARTYVRTLTSSFTVLMLRKPGLLCQRSLGQSCYADVLRSMVMKIGSCFDQSTCCVISVLLLLLSLPEPIWYLCQLSITSLIQMNTFSISGWQTLLAECVPPTIKLHSLSFSFITAWGNEIGPSFMSPLVFWIFFPEKDRARFFFFFFGEQTSLMFDCLCHVWTPSSCLQAQNVSALSSYPYFYVMGATSGQAPCQKIPRQPRCFWSLSFLCSALQAASFSFNMPCVLRHTGLVGESALLIFFFSDPSLLHSLPSNFFPFRLSNSSPLAEYFL